jgi:hypothetical protein
LRDRADFHERRRDDSAHFALDIPGGIFGPLWRLQIDSGLIPTSPHHWLR